LKNLEAQNLSIEAGRSGAKNSLPEQNGKTANRTSSEGPLPKRTQRQCRGDGFAMAAYSTEARSI